MNELKILKTRMVARDGTPVKLIYDEEGDILEILFGEAVPSTGIALTDNIILHLERKQKRAVSLMLLNFSILSEQTEYGPRSFALEKLRSLPEELQELVLRVITTLPVNQFLKMSQLQTAPMKQMPVAFVESQPMMAYA